MMMSPFQGVLLSRCPDNEIMLAAAVTEPRLPELSRAMSRCLTVMFDYDDKRRRVEVHAIGQSTKDGSFVMRGYMPDDDRPWRLFSIDKIKNLELTFDDSRAPREGYTMDDKQMSVVLVQIAQ